MQKKTIRLKQLARMPELIELLRREPAEKCHARYSPCPYIGCRFHLWCDFNGSGSLTINFPEIPPDAQHLMEETCGARVAANGDHNWLEVARHLGAAPAAAERYGARSLERFATAWHSAATAK